MKKLIFILASLVLIMAMTGCGESVEKDPFADFVYERKEEKPNVQPVERRDFEVYETIFAQSIPKAKITHKYNEVTGYFNEYTVDLMDEVSKGDVVAVLDAGELGKEIRDQKIAYEKARLIHERAVLRYETTGEGEFEMRTTALDFKYEEKKYNELLEKREALELKAELDGIFSKRYVRAGDFITTDTAICDITDESEIYVSFEDDENRGIIVGSTLEIQIRNSTDIISAEVIRIDGEKIIMKPERVHSSFERTGTLVYVRILRDKRLDTLVISDKSIHEEAGRQFVYVYEDGNVNERVIKTGISDSGYTEVLFGLEEGELVVE